jgi:hypothetical protein
MTGSVGDLLRPITCGDLRGWQGLPSDLTLSELTSALPPDSKWSGRAQLGKRHVQASYQWVRVPGSDTRFRAWFDAERVLLLDVASPPIAVRPNQLADVIGEEPASLDTWQGTLPMPASELVFPVHGIAVFVNRETEAVWHVALFPPLTLQSYTDDLRIDMQTHRHQAPQR